MSTETQEAPVRGTQPTAEHQWLQQLVGEWQTETEMVMGPNQPVQTTKGVHSIKSLGGLWAFIEGNEEMPDGTPMTYYWALGYDVSFKEYRGCRLVSVSSHLWKYVGDLSADGKVMTLNCEGPNMERDGETANYRDVIEIIDANHLTMKSYFQDARGDWQQMIKVHHTRI